jgi:hypothetical protein
MITQEGPGVVRRWPLVKVAPAHTRDVTLLSGDWVRLSTHYLPLGRGRSVLCTDTHDCPLCTRAGGRTYWYLPVQSHPGAHRGLVELSATTSADLETVVRYGGYQLAAGAMVRLSRKTTKSGARCEYLGYDERVTAIDLHEWVTPLMVIYGLPGMAIGETLGAYGRRVKSVVEMRGRAALAELLIATRGSGHPVGSR